MMIRSMTPKVIVADEIGSREDVKEIENAMCMGVNGIFTVHASNYEELKDNKNIKEIMLKKYFKRIIIIENRNGKVVKENEYIKVC